MGFRLGFGFGPFYVSQSFGGRRRETAPLPFVPMRRGWYPYPSDEGWAQNLERFWTGGHWSTKTRERKPNRILRRTVGTGSFFGPRPIDRPKKNRQPEPRKPVVTRVEHQAGWYTDPRGVSKTRYWDGLKWTGKTSG